MTPQIAPKAAAEALEAFGKKHIAVLRGRIGDTLSDRLDEEIALLRAQAAASVEPVEIADPAHDHILDASPEPVAWPSTASEISDFIGPHCNFRQHKFSDVEPHEDDVYEVSAHDLLSSFQQWGEEHPPAAAERIAALEAELAKVKSENEWLADERRRSLADVEALNAERDSAVARLRYLYDDTMSKLIWHDKPPISFDQYAFNIDAARKEKWK
jgi:hypothetical protein